jgi:hypothetical protein
MPAGSTYSTIATTTLGSAAASYTFTSIPTTYTDLVLIVNSKMTSGADNLRLQVGNSSVDETNKYSFVYMAGDGSTTFSGKGSNLNDTLSGRLGATSSTSIINFMNYSNTTTFKTIISRGNDASTSGQTAAYICLWRSTVAINTIKVLEQVGDTFAAGTTLTLYGIAAA